MSLCKSCEKPFNELITGEEFMITKNGPVLMKLGGQFRGVYITGSRKGQTWEPKNFASQGVFV